VDANPCSSVLRAYRLASRTFVEPRQFSKCAGKMPAMDALSSRLAQNVNLSAKHRPSGDGEVQTIVEKNRDP
jgi:hypothetical protein